VLGLAAFCLAPTRAAPPAVPAGGAVSCPERAISVAFYEFGALFSGASGEKAGGFSGSGIDVDLLRELRRRSGCRFEGSTMTRARIWSELEAGRLDMTTSGIATPEREKRYAFAHYILLKHYVWMLESHAPVAGGLAEFMANPKLRWGAVRGYTHTPAYDAALDEARAQGRVTEATDDRALLRLLAEGSVDAVIGHSIVMRRYAAEHPRQPRIVALDWSPKGSVVPRGLVLSRAHFSEEQIAGWRRLVAEIVHDGTLLRIARRHVGEEDATELVPPDGAAMRSVSP
jgi:polar amino acid transport system substrate-binding protein